MPVITMQRTTAAAIADSDGDRLTIEHGPGQITPFIFTASSGDQELVVFATVDDLRAFGEALTAMAEEAARRSGHQFPNPISNRKGDEHS